MKEEKLASAHVGHRPGTEPSPRAPSLGILSSVGALGILGHDPTLLKIKLLVLPFN